MELEQRVEPLSDQGKKFQHFVDAINAVRTSDQMCGTQHFAAAAPLQGSDKLYEAAYEHSKDMAASNMLEHFGSGRVTDITGQQLGKQSTMIDRVNRQHYRWSKVGENIGAGTSITTGKQIVAKWMTSYAHCINIMDPDFTEVGMARVENNQSTYIYYWTQLFGKSR